MTSIVVFVGLFAAGPVAKAQPVHFDDPKLKAVVEAKLGVSNPTQAQMLSLTELSATGQGIADLTGLEYALSLQGLQLSGNQISHLSPLAGLTKLVELSLHANQISDLSPLAGLTKLKLLGVQTNQISDISPLVGLTTLVTIYLRYNPLHPDACAIYIPQIESHGTTVYYDPCWDIVPDVVGMGESEATSAITSAGLTVDATKWYGPHDTIPAGHVRSQASAAGTLAAR